MRLGRTYCQILSLSSRSLCLNALLLQCSIERVDVMPLFLNRRCVIRLSVAESIRKRKIQNQQEVSEYPLYTTFLGNQFFSDDSLRKVVSSSFPDKFLGFVTRMP